MENEEHLKSRVESSAGRDFVLLLISLYRDCPELWNVKSKDYLNKKIRRHAMGKILNVLKNYEPDFDEYKLKKKINVLRTNFNREYRRLNQKKPTDPYSDDTQEPNLWYYRKFLFIKQQLSISNNNKFDQSLTEGLPRSSGQAAIIKKRKKPTANTSDEHPVLTESHFASLENDTNILAKIWAMKLKRLAPDQRLYAEKIINDTLFEAEMGTLTRNGVCFMTSAVPKAPTKSPIPYSSPASSFNPLPFPSTFVRYKQCISPEPDYIYMSPETKTNSN